MGKNLIHELGAITALTVHQQYADGLRDDGVDALRRNQRMINALQFLCKHKNQYINKHIKNYTHEYATHC